MHDEPHFNAHGGCDCLCQTCITDDGLCICPDCDPDVCDLHPDV